MVTPNSQNIQATLEVDEAEDDLPNDDEAIEATGLTGISSRLAKLLPDAVVASLVEASPVTIINKFDEGGGTTMCRDDEALVHAMDQARNEAERVIARSVSNEVGTRRHEIGQVSRWSPEDFASQRQLLVRLESCEEALDVLQTWRYTVLSKEGTLPTSKRQNRRCRVSSSVELEFDNLRRYTANGKPLFAKDRKFLVRGLPDAAEGTRDNEQQVLQWSRGRIKKARSDSRIVAQIPSCSLPRALRSQVVCDLVWTDGSSSSFDRCEEAVRLGILAEEMVMYAPRLRAAWSTFPWAARRVGRESPTSRCPVSVAARRPLDTSQQDFVTSVCRQRDGSESYFPLHVLHGPPGTGKTWTMACAIAQLVTEYPDARVLVCEPTNAAMQAMMEALDSIGVFAAEGSYSTNPGSQRRSIGLRCLPAASRSVAASSPSVVKFSHVLRHSFHTPAPSARYEHLLGYRVVVCTLCVAGDLPCIGRYSSTASTTRDSLNMLRMFSHVVVDEAGFTTESQFMQATRFLNWHTRCGPEQVAVAPTVLMLAGDHKQLGPVMSAFAGRVNSTVLPPFLETPFEVLMRSSADAAAASSPPDVTPATITTSTAKLAAERQLLLKHAICRLGFNYRSHPVIVNLFSGLFYDHRVVSGRTAAPTSSVSASHLSTGQKCVTVGELAACHGMPTAWLDLVQGLHARPTNSKSIQNLHEASIVAQLVQALLALPSATIGGRPMGGFLYSPADIGVVTPYAAQKHAILRALKQGPIFGRGVQESVEVDSVERFQGREKKVMIISTVRAPSGDSRGYQSLGFLDCPRRTNVSLSRAVERQIIVGHAEFLSANSSNWKAVVDHHRRCSCLLTHKAS